MPPLDVSDLAALHRDGHLSAALRERLAAAGVRIDPGARTLDPEVVRTILERLRVPFCSYGLLPNGDAPDVVVRRAGGRTGQWDTATLTWSADLTGLVYTPGPTDPPAATVVAQAFAAWAAVAAPTLALTPAAPGTRADIRLTVATSGGDLGTPRGVLGHAYPPPSGVIELDGTETWTAGMLFPLVLHELGHALGLGHSDDRNSLMYPYVLTGVIDAESAEAFADTYDWSAPAVLPDRASSERPALVTVAAPGFLGTALTARMVWKGAGDDVTGWTADHDPVVGWSAQRPLPHVRSPFTPAAAQAVPGATRLLLAWRNVGDRRMSWMREGDPSARPVPDAGSAAAPALATSRAGGLSVLAWRGVGEDTQVWWSALDGDRWTPQRPIAGSSTSHGPALVYVGRVLHAFWKAEDASTVHTSSLDTAVDDALWTPARRVEYVRATTDGRVAHAIGTSTTPAAATRRGRIQLAWKGAGDDPLVWTGTWDGEWLAGQVVVAGSATAAGPGVAEVGDGVLLAWRGPDHDGRLRWSRR